MDNCPIRNIDPAVDRVDEDGWNLAGSSNIA
jgi:hypothetical protein